MRRALPLFFVSLVVFLAGCGDKAPVKQATRPKHYRSVISLSPNTTEILLSNADSSIVKGRTQSCDWPPTMVAAIPIVSSVKPDYEKIQKIKPDLIVYDTDLFSTAEVDKLKAATGADVFAFEAKNVIEYIAKLQELGSVVASEMRFNDYVNRVMTEVGAASGAKLNPVPKVAVIMPGRSGDNYIVGTDGFLADIIRIGGGQIVGPKGEHFVPLNPETLVSLNPDVILVNGTKADHAGYDSLIKDPRFATVTAIKQNRVGVIESNVLLRSGQRVDQLIKAAHRLMAPEVK